MMLISLGSGAALAIALISVVSHFTSSTTTTTSLPEPAIVGTSISPRTLPTLDGRSRLTIPARGHRTVLVFFASWCGPCRRELPEVQRFAESAPSDVSVIGVAANDAPQAASEFLDQLGVTILAVSDADGSVTSSTYGFGTLPETVFIDSMGVVRHVVFGGLNRQTLRQSVGALR
jgi:cytochrome c biogenesis protein CcmG/thiol:disulfide interchange protein DsbE